MSSQIIEIKDKASGSSARIMVSLGFNCFSWQPVLAEGAREMLWSATDFAAVGGRPSASGIPLLFPFGGRIGGAKFEFNGRQYDLEPGDGLGNAIHGFVINRPWRVVEQQPARVVGEFQASVDDPMILKRWPADFRIRVSYEVKGAKLISEIRYDNPGDGLLPCGFATHTYFRLPLSNRSNAADTVVTVPAEAYWELENMIPTGRVLPVPAHLQHLKRGQVLKDTQFDTVFTKLLHSSDGAIHTNLLDSTTGRTFAQVFDTSFTQCVVYTPGHREAICMEPYTCVPDAIRLAAEGHETGLQLLQPGESFETTIRLEVS
jgi:aldose 1-epimerase